VASSIIMPGMTVDIAAPILKALHGDRAPSQEPRASRWIARSMRPLAGVADTDAWPAWMTEDDVDVHAQEFRRTGLRGRLNRYRNIGCSSELQARWAKATMTVLALYIRGLERRA
jgi:hypothetical protein